MNKKLQVITPSNHGVKKWSHLASFLIELVTYIPTRASTILSLTTLYPYLHCTASGRCWKWSRTPNWDTKILINSILPALLTVGKAVTPHVLYSKSCSRSVKRTFSYTKWTRHPGATPIHFCSGRPRTWAWWGRQRYLLPTNFMM